jgi:alpha/beta superfamily hydrolase
VKQIVEDKSQLILTILAMILASFAIGQNIAENSARERERNDIALIIDAKIQAGIERARADMQQQVQQAKTTADAGATDGRLALDRVEKAVAKLEAKGLIKESH